MKTIPQKAIERIRQNADIAALIRTSGVELHPAGRDLQGRCPFHDDRSPSLVVTPRKGLWHCLGECNAGGSVFDWVMRREGVGFPEAFMILNGGKMRTEERDQNGKIATGEGDVPFAAADGFPGGGEIVERVLEHYQTTLKNTPHAQRYLEGRGLLDEGMITCFRIGYADGSLKRILPSRQSKEGRRLADILIRFGLIRKSGYEHFEGCIVVPLFDETGSMVGMYGRKSHDRANRHLYLPGEQRGIFNRPALKSPDVILCESHFDALTFYHHGLLNVSCTNGVNGYSDELHRALVSGDVRRVYFAFDRDKAGDAAALKLAQRLTEAGIETLRVNFPLGMDANEYARKQAEPAEALRTLLEQAETIGGEPETEDAVFRSEHLPSSAAEKEAAVQDENPPPLRENRNEQPSSVENAELTVCDEEVRVSYGVRDWRVRGLFKNATDHVMRINLKISSGAEFHVETLDLYDVRRRDAFISRAAGELGIEPDIIKHDVGRLLNELERLQGDHLQRKLRPEDRKVELPPERLRAALEYGRTPDLWKRIVGDAEEGGLVGERVNYLVAFLAAISRKTDAPLAVIIQSSSAAGKTTLMEAVLRFVPEEDVIQYSFMTGQSLYYMQSRDLKHRILAISEEEGAERAKYAIKLLQSEGRISIVTTVKDPVSGLPDAREFAVEGPVMIFLTSTNAEIDEELLNRSLLLTVNEEREQTRRIQSLQRERTTLDGILKKRVGERCVELERDFQRTLRPLEVSIPPEFRLSFPDTHLRMRRDNRKFLTLIRAVALLHQHQREIRTARDEGGEDFEYIEATAEDVRLSKFLAARVFGISLDELAPQTRRLLGKIHAMVEEECTKHSIKRRDFRFTRRMIREHTGMSDTQIRLHLGRLADLEYVVLHGGGQGRLTEYELLYSGEGRNGALFLPGLSDPTDDGEKERGYAEFFDTSRGIG